MNCSHCGANNEDTCKFCSKCGSPLLVSPESPSSNDVMTERKRYAVGKNPAVALILSLLIAGAGQFYNGDTKKGAIMFLAAVVLGIFTWGLGWLGVIVWSIYDAYQVASGKAALW